MFNDIELTKNGNYKECCSDSEVVKDYAKKFPLGHWSVLGLGVQEKWYGTQNYITNLKDSGILLQMSRSPISKTADLPVFRASSALDRGFLKKKGGERTIHCSADPSNADLLFRTINQLSIYGSIAGWCD